MNNLERLLCISEKRLKEAQQEIISLQSLRKYEELLQTLNQEKMTLQQKVDQQQREITFLEQDRDNLLVAIREQSEFIISMSDLAHNPALKKYHVIQQLESLRQEWEKATNQVFTLQGQVRKLSLENGQLMGKISDLSLKQKHDQTLQKQHLEFELKQRDQLIEELVEKLKQYNMEEQKMEAESISGSESGSGSQNDTQIQINQQNDCQTYLEQQIIIKEQQIVDLQKQILELQQKQHQPQQIIDQQQLMQAIPQILRNKVIQIQYLEQQLLPQLCMKIGNLENNHNQFKTLLKENQQLREQNKQLQQHTETIQKDKNETQADLDYAYKNIQIILKQNQNLIQVLMNNNHNKEQIMEILKQDNPIYMENTPFDSIEDLVDSYLSLRKQLNKISRQCLK